MSGVEIRESARRHGIDDEAIRHALAHPAAVFDEDGFEMVIGADPAG